MDLADFCSIRKKYRMWETCWNISSWFLIVSLQPFGNKELMDAFLAWRRLAKMGVILHQCINALKDYGMIAWGFLFPICFCRACHLIIRRFFWTLVTQSWTIFGMQSQQHPIGCHFVLVYCRSHDFISYANVTCHHFQKSIFDREIWLDFFHRESNST